MLEQFPRRLGRQFWQEMPAFIQEHPLQRPVLLHLQQGITQTQAIVAFSEQCEAKLVHVVLLLYLAVSSALER